MGAKRHLAVWIAAIVWFVIGAGWYSALASTWLAGIGKTGDQLAAETAASPLPYAIGFVAIVVMCYALAWLIDRLGARTAGDGARVGAVIAVAFVGGQLALNYGFEWRPVALWLINTGYAVIGLAIAGAIVGGMASRASPAAA